MKNLSIVTLLLIFVVSTVSYAQPKLEFDCGNQYNWGKVKPNESPLKCSIKLYNRGDEVLKITKVKPGCGCTKGKLSSDEIAPGDSANIDFTLSIRPNPGNVTKSVTFHTNTPDQAKQVIFLKANVFTGYKLLPRRLNFFNCELNKEAISKIVVSNTSDEVLKISRVVVKPVELIIKGVDDKTVIKPGENIAIEVRYTPIKPGNFYPRITLFSDTHKDISSIKINGNGRVKEIKKETPKKANKKDLNIIKSK